MLYIDELYRDICLHPSLKAEFDCLLRLVEDQRTTFTDLQHVPLEIVQQMKKAGFFRATVPVQFGGNAGKPTAFLQAIEKLSSIDGSAGWVASFGSSNFYLTALPVKTQMEIYRSGPDQMFAGGLFPVQPSQQTDEGWMVNGQWKFSSGCKTADWIGVGISGQSNDGFNSTPLTAVMPASEVDVVDNWEVMGMEGTGSHDLKVEGKWVDTQWTFIRGAASNIDEPLYKFPTVALSANVHTAVSLGLAYAAIQEILRMCHAQTTTGAPSLANRAYFRTNLAQATAEYLGTRAYFYEVISAAWHEIESVGEVSRHTTNNLRLSATYTAQTCMNVVQRCYKIAGINGIFKRSRMQKILRDAQVITQHAHINESVFDGAGAVLANIEPFKGYL